MIKLFTIHSSCSRLPSPADEHHIELISVNDTDPLLSGTTYIDASLIKDCAYGKNQGEVSVISCSIMNALVGTDQRLSVCHRQCRSQKNHFPGSVTAQRRGGWAGLSHHCHDSGGSRHAVLCFCWE